MILERVVVGPLQTNAYVIGCSATRKGAIIDPGDESRRLLLIAETKGLTIETVLLTHGHVDHVAAAGDVKKATGAPIRLHAEDRTLYDHAAEQGRLFGLRVAELPPPDGTLSDGETISLGELAVRVVGTPGHSLGSVSFHLEAAKALFAGDTLFQGSIGRTDLPGGSLDQLMSSIRERMLVLPDDTRVYCGHGSVTTIGAERRSNPFILGLV